MNIPNPSPKSRTHLLLLSTFLLTLACAVAAPESTPVNTRDLYLRTLGPQGTLRLEFIDHIKTPQYHWPRTLLTYPVRFTGKVQPGQVSLRDVSTGKPVPFQLSSVKLADGSLSYAEVNFFSDLPSGGKIQVELGSSNPQSVAPETKLVKESESYVLDAGKLKVRVPTSRSSSAGQKTPGPVMALQRDAGWIGESFIASPKHAVKSVTTDIIENGPLFLTARIAYAFEGGGSYTATVKAISGYDFIEFSEEMKGLAKTDGVFVKNAWKGFSANRRGKISLDQPQVNTFRGEDPAFDGPTRIEDPEKELLVRMEITPSNEIGRAHV